MFSPVTACVAQVTGAKVGRTFPKMNELVFHCYHCRGVVNAENKTLKHNIPDYYFPIFCLAIGYLSCNIITTLNFFQLIRDGVSMDI